MRFRHAFLTFLTAGLVLLGSCVKNAGPNQDMLKVREIQEALALSLQFADSNAFRSAQYAEVAIRNAYKIHDTILLCEGYCRLAFANIQQNKLDEGIKNLSAVFGIIKKNNQPELLLKAYYLFGLAGFKRKSFDQSLLFYDSALVMIPRLHWGGENDEQLIRTAVSVMSGVGLAGAKTGLVHETIKMMSTCNAFTTPVKLKMYAKGFLAEMYRAIGSYDTAILYTDTAIALASHQYDDSFLIKQWGLRANVYYQLGKYDSCIVYNKRAEVLAIRMKQKRLLPPIYNNLGSVYQKISNQPLAVVYFSKSLKIKEESGDSIGIAVTLSNLGIIYKNWGDQHKAQEYFSRALKINQKLNNQAGISINYLNFGELYFILGQFESAVDNFNRALEIKKEQKDVYGCIIALDGLGRSYRDQPGKSQMALTYFTEGKRLAENINAKYWIASLNFEMGELFRMQGNQPKAIAFFRHSIAVSEEEALDEIKAEATRSLLESALQASGQAELTRLFNEYNVLTDSLREREKDETTANLLVQYETEKKKKENLLLTQEVAYQKLLIESSTIQIIGLVVIIIMLAAFGAVTYWLYRKKRLAYEKLVKQNIASGSVENRQNVIPSEVNNLKQPSIHAMKTPEQDLMNRLIHFLESEKPYLNPNLTLEDLSKTLNTNRTYLSTLINNNEGKNFNAFINEYRVAEARRILIGIKSNLYSVEDVGRMSGFGTKSSFYTCFKSIIGVPPAYFRDYILKSSQE